MDNIRGVITALYRTAYKGLLSDLLCVSVCVCVCAGQQSSQIGSPPEEVFDASRQRCHADGDHNMTTRTTCSNSTLAEELLRELTLYGPGSPDFSLADVDR